MEKLRGSEWVKIRHKCTVGAIFERLRGEVESDVNARIELNAAEEISKRFEFKFDSTGDLFSASVQRNEFKGSVRFRIANGAIEALDRDDISIIKGTVNVSDDGICRIKVADLELDSWQFRRRALERLFFELP
jgi:hypothetical protein